MHTKYFKNLEQVEEIFGITITYDEQEAILTYIATGIRPDPGGCWHCNAANMRRLTGWIDRYETLVDEGEAAFGTHSSELGLPFGGDWG
jgi:hypothetical protein